MSSLTFICNLGIAYGSIALAMNLVVLGILVWNDLKK